MRLANLSPSSSIVLTIRQGTCKALGKVLFSQKVRTSSTGTLKRSRRLTVAQTKALRLPLVARAGSTCRAFQPKTAATQPSASPTPTPKPCVEDAETWCPGWNHQLFAWTNTGQLVTFDGSVQGWELWPGNTDIRPTDGHSFVLVTVRVRVASSGWGPTTFGAKPLKTPGGLVYPDPIGRTPSFAKYITVGSEWTTGYLTYDVPNTDIRGPFRWDDIWLLQ